MESSIFAQITLVVAVAAVVAIIMRLLKQPLIMSYILTGILVGPSMLNLVHAKEAFESFSELGITLLLFIIGLGLNAGVVKSLGRVSLVTAGAILIAVGFTGHLTALLLGFDNTTAVIMGLAMFFSSTIIILKVLSDNKELSRLYGQIAVGVVLLDDVVATLALVAVAAMGTNANGLDISSLGLLGLKGVGLGVGLYILGNYIIPPISRLFAKSQELLFLFAIAWGLAISGLFEISGFSHEVGALFAGVALASLPYATEMASKLKPLRDFFIVIFFVTLGEHFTFGAIQQSIIPAFVLSLVVLLGKPFFVTFALGIQGYTRLTSFKTAIHLSQISEFSIILVMFAVTSGVINPEATPVITLMALITIGVSTYLMKYDDQLYHLLEHHLRHFERTTIREPRHKRILYPAVLFGYHKGGYEYIKAFREMKMRYLVIDYDPDIIDHLEAQGIHHAYGDATDEELLEETAAAEAKLVVSTITDASTNRILLKYLRRHGNNVSFICHANNYDEAAELYQLGASYVSLPHAIGSERVSSFIKRHGMSHSALRDYREKHLVTIGRQALK